MPKYIYIYIWGDISISIYIYISFIYSIILWVIFYSPFIFIYICYIILSLAFHPRPSLKVISPKSTSLKKVVILDELDEWLGFSVGAWTEYHWTSPVFSMGNLITHNIYIYVYIYIYIYNDHFENHHIWRCSIIFSEPSELFRVVGP